MWGGIASLLAAIVNALPKFLARVDDWRAEREIKRHQAAKDERNRQAIADARRPGPRH